MTRQPELTAVVVSYNTRDLVLETLERLSVASWIRCVVVDNASGDGSADAISTRFPDLDLIRNIDNVGFATAANQGMERALSPYIVLLNPDTDASPQLLQTMVDYLNRNPAVWATAPRLVGLNGNGQTLAAGFRPTPLRGFLYFFGVSYVLPWPSAGFSVPQSVRRPIDVDWLSGACLMVRRTVLDQVGGFDPTFFMYGEDMDWSRRMRAAGGRLVLMADHDVRHARAASSGHEVVSAQWLGGLDRYVRPQTSRLGARLFFMSAAAGFWLRGLRFVLPPQNRRRTALWGYARAASRIAVGRS